MKIKKVSFIVSAPTIRETPPTGCFPEVVVVGRSNVGKSSFICKLTNQKIAKVSSTPGKTRLINYFLVDESWYLVDLPGYGFAKVSKREQERWKIALEEYLSLRRGIRLAILLVDCRHEVKESDLQMYDWLCGNNLNTMVVLTKCDKIGKGQQAKARQGASKAFQIPFEQILTISSHDGQGFDALGKCLDEILA